ncbi:lactate utilization protein [Maridesulfovibrio ferrireducens]|uniref:lactate utilization protein n=1 Tax=Maridesulfovibrio ferrireducens TaxID=246191 RepID=UPI001A2DA62F|nr:lactate utilization protein [Maridesulfovibrio ferrireducens]MBI9112297.1 lactate utilization protein [Maridesulfovibrio ferrireducens]
MHPIQNFWNIRLGELKEVLDDNGFTTHIANNSKAAAMLVLEKIIPQLSPASISFGGSMTVVDSGLYDQIKQLKKVKVIDTYDTKPSADEKIERRRQSLLSDLFITSANAVTNDGELVNLDGTGNRVAAMAFGPKSVVVLVGRNKICGDLEAATRRIKEYVAPVNAMRLKRKTPCAVTGTCADCSSPERICSIWGITEKSSPKGRIHIILINEDLGF